MQLYYAPKSPLRLVCKTGLETEPESGSSITCFPNEVHASYMKVKTDFEDYASLFGLFQSILGSCGFQLPGRFPFLGFKQTHSTLYFLA